MATFREALNKVKRAGMAFNFLYRFLEKTNKMKGEIFIKAFEQGVEIFSYESPNVIVNTASVLVASLLKDPNQVSGGITHLAVGVGEPGWDLQNPPAPTTNQTTLASELIRKRVTSTAFIDPTSGEVSEIPTNVVDYSFEFTEAEAVGAIVELGLFGGEATEESGSGLMVNYRTFPVINKTSAMSFVIVVRITT